MSKQQVQPRTAPRDPAATETSTDDAPAEPSVGFGGLSIDFSGDSGVAAPSNPAPLPDLAIDFGGIAVGTATGGPGFVSIAPGRTET